MKTEIREKRSGWKEAGTLSGARPHTASSMALTLRSWEKPIATYHKTRVKDQNAMPRTSMDYFFLTCADEARHYDTQIMLDMRAHHMHSQ